MEAEAAKYIGAGLACVALTGAGLGIGNIFGNYLSAALRNPSAAPARFPTCCSASPSPRRPACSASSSP